MTYIHTEGTTQLTSHFSPHLLCKNQCLWFVSTVSQSHPGQVKGKSNKTKTHGTSVARERYSRSGGPAALEGVSDSVRATPLASLSSFHSREENLPRETAHERPLSGTGFSEAGCGHHLSQLHCNLLSEE